MYYEVQVLSKSIEVSWRPFVQWINYYVYLQWMDYDVYMYSGVYHMSFFYDL